MSVVWVDTRTYKEMILEAARSGGEVVIEARGFAPVLIRFYDQKYVKSTATEIKNNSNES